MTDTAMNPVNQSLPDDAAEQVPAGWYRLDPEATAEVAGGGVAHRSLAGVPVVVWAPHGGKVVTTGAHCPHFGAHLGHGGTVVDGCLQCPFHGWRWRPDGTHASIPGHDTTTSAKAVTHPTRTVGDGILVWHGPDGEEWEPADLTGEIPDGARYLGDIRGKGQGLHLAMMEGIVDVAHFPVLHDLPAPTVTEMSFGDSPTAVVGLELDSGAHAHLTFDGLSRVRERMTHGNYTLWMVGEYWLSGPTSASGLVRFWGDGPTHAGVDRIYRMFRRVYEHQAREDQAIWLHRKYGAPQAYGPDDRPVWAFRRWAARFFS